jgi:hypothetical protein
VPHLPLRQPESAQSRDAGRLLRRPAFGHPDVPGARSARSLGRSTQLSNG